MNNVFVYIELENGVPADVSLELLTKGRELATTLGVKLKPSYWVIIWATSLRSWPNTAPIPCGRPTTRSSLRSARCPIRL